MPLDVSIAVPPVVVEGEQTYCATGQLAGQSSTWFPISNSSGLFAAHSPSSSAPFVEQTVAFLKLLPALTAFTCAVFVLGGFKT